MQIEIAVAGDVHRIVLGVVRLGFDLRLQAARCEYKYEKQQQKQ